MRTWLQKTEKFGVSSARARSSVTAVAGAVVSKPIAKKQTCRSGSWRGELERVERRVDHAHVRAARLRLEQRAAPARHAQHVAERRERDAVRLGDRDRVVHAAHRDHAHRAARPVHELDLVREQLLEAVPVDRVRVAAADLHHAHHLARRDERADLGGEAARERRVAVLVDVSHEAPPSSRSSAIPAWQSSRSPGRASGTRSIATRSTSVAERDHGLEPVDGATRAATPRRSSEAALGRRSCVDSTQRSAARRSRDRPVADLVELRCSSAPRRRSSSVSCACSSSIRASAKPTWTSTQSPGLDRSAPARRRARR